jgi:hypothetical protein
MSKKETASVLVRLPQEVDDWIREQAERTLTSRSSEILRMIRQRMDSERREKAAG